MSYISGENCRGGALFTIHGTSFPVSPVRWLHISAKYTLGKIIINVRYLNTKSMPLQLEDNDKKEALDKEPRERFRNRTQCEFICRSGLLPDYIADYSSLTWVRDLC